MNPSQAYEQQLARDAPARRKAEGVYYTPDAIVARVVEQTLEPLLASRRHADTPLTILDPACGGGAFLTTAYRRLLDWHQASGSVLHTDERRHLLLTHCFGVDLDPQAVELTRCALAEACGSTVDLRANIRVGNALLGTDAPETATQRFDWQAAYPDVMARGGFNVVLANPPWGQKAIAHDEAVRQYLHQRFPSSAGIFDLFRPFVELGVNLTAPGGRFGMVLPDIILLKDYPQTRLLLLDALALEHIDCWGPAFPDAVIDAVSIVGCKQPAPEGHTVRIGEPASGNGWTIPQAHFRANPRHIFNLHLHPARRRVLDQLAHCPRLGTYFEAHEGVHSGNVRAELFVDAPLDESCRELYFGRDELVPYELRWRGRYLRLAALPAKRSTERYANVGRPGWYEQDKLLVRRTGDHVLAAVDRSRRYASNNFFLVLPRRPGALSLDGLCALLNSSFMTWYFRAIEPRQGRPFAELKIKHLTAFPLPDADCGALNELGSERPGRPLLDAAIDREVLRLFGLPPEAIE
ncbi:MAG: N-6 DNA methylase [Planctomycetia bacterium]|nr:N-6 DNA methylase [Planctomycetia bacterium]